MSGRRKGYNYQKVDIDLSILRGPLSLPEEGVLQIIKCIQSGTSEIRETLLFEIDVIYECRVCRGLFRSLTNLLAHKRIYCQEKYKDTKLEFVPSYNDNETVVVQPEAPEESAKEDEDRAEENESNSVIDQMSEGKFEGNSEPYKFYTKAVERQQEKDAERTTAVVTLKRISCNPNAVYQSCQLQNSESDTNAREKKQRQSSKDSEDDEEYESSDEKDSSKYDKKEHPINKDEALVDDADVVTIQPEAASGPLRMNLRQRSGGEVTTPIIISLSQRADCEVKTKTCLICNTQYSSLKTLHFHMINCHSEKRTIFPCLYCSQEFTQMVGVTRHLSRVHHKSKETVEKLRLTLRKKAYSKPLEDIKDGKVDKLEKTEKVVKKRDDSVSKRTLHKITMHTVRGQQGNTTEGATGSFKCIHCSKLFNKQESLDRHASFCFTSQATMGQLSGTELPKNLHGNMEETMETGSSTDMGRWSTSDLSTEDAKHLSNMINEETLTCLKCDQSYSNISNLHRHAVRHLGRTRFKCRLCQYTAYNRSECKTHLRRVHPGRVFDEAELNSYIQDLGLDMSKGRSRSRSPSPADEVSDNGRAKSSSGKPSTYMDHLTTLRTRSGLYIKPRFAVKRKAEDDESLEEEKTNSEKRSRADTGEDDNYNDSNILTEESQLESQKDSDDVFVSDSADSQDSACSEQIESGTITVTSHTPGAEQMTPTESSVNECLNFPRVPSLIIKKVSLSESCVLQPPKPEGVTVKGTVLHNSIHPTEDHLVRPSSPSCSSRSRDTSPDIMLEQHTPKEAVQRDWADVWESKSEDGEEEFLGFRLVSDTQGVSKKAVQMQRNAARIICEIEAERQQNLQKDEDKISPDEVCGNKNYEQAMQQNVHSSVCQINEEKHPNLPKEVVKSDDVITYQNFQNEMEDVGTELNREETVKMETDAQTLPSESSVSEPFVATSESKERTESLLESENHIKMETEEIALTSQSSVSGDLAASSVMKDSANSEEQQQNSETLMDLDLKDLSGTKETVRQDISSENVTMCETDSHVTDVETENHCVPMDATIECRTNVETENTKDLIDKTSLEEMPSSDMQSEARHTQDLHSLQRSGVNVDAKKPCNCQESECSSNIRDSSCEELSSIQRTVTADKTLETADEDPIQVGGNASSVPLCQGGGSEISQTKQTTQRSPEKSVETVICKATTQEESVLKEYIQDTDSCIEPATSTSSFSSVEQDVDAKTVCAGLSNPQDQIHGSRVKTTTGAEEYKCPKIAIHSTEDVLVANEDTLQEKTIPEIIIDSVDSEDCCDVTRIVIDPADDKDKLQSQGSSEGTWKSGFLIPEIIICPPSVSACSEESDESGENATTRNTDVTDTFDKNTVAEADITKKTAETPEIQKPAEEPSVTVEDLPQTVEETEQNETVTLPTQPRLPGCTEPKAAD